MTSITFHAPVVSILVQLVDDGQIALGVTHVTQLSDEVVCDVVDRSHETADLRLVHQSLAELRPVLVPLAALPVPPSHTHVHSQKPLSQCGV